MDDQNNLQLIQQLFSHYAKGNIPAFLSMFSPDAVWVEPGNPEDIPYAGSFAGIQEISKLLSILAQSLHIKSFVPNLFLANGHDVAVFGDNEATVISTGKTYSTKWVYLFTVQDQLVTHLQVYMDTLIIAKAFSQLSAAGK